MYAAVEVLENLSFPETFRNQITPENWWLEDEMPVWEALFFWVSVVSEKKGMATNIWIVLTTKGHEGTGSLF